MTEKADIVKKELIVEKGDRRICGMLYVPGEKDIKGAVVLSHGYNGSCRDFDYECRALSGAGYLAYAYDFCGGSAGGRSTGLDTTGMTLFTEKEDLLAVFDAVSALAEGKKTFLFGGSQGGCVTALSAAEIRERAAAMILYYPALMIPDNWRETYKSEEEIPEVTDFWGMRLGRGFFTSIRDFSVYDHIGAFENPVLIICGDRDEIVSLGVVEKAAGIYKDERTVILEGEGHGFTPEGTVKATEHILKFLGEFED